MKEVGYYNGKLGNPNELQCSIMDRAVYFGDGCYDAALVCNGVIHLMEEHLDRFYNSCRLLRIPFAMPREELREILCRLVDAYDGNGGIGVLYWQTSRGTASRSHAFPEQTRPNILATLTPYTMSPKERQFDVITVEDTRYQLCHIKTLNLIPNVLAAQRAKEAGCDEALFHRGMYVTEMSHSNVSFLIDGVLTHHPFDHQILAGIMLRQLIKTAQALGIPTSARNVTLAEAMNADELIVTSSGTLCCPIAHVDGIPVGGKGGETFHRLREAMWQDFRRAVHETA